jgi:nickel-dependent lactate racemase
MNFSEATALPGQSLPSQVIRQTLHAALDGRFRGQRVLVLIPDHTRSLPLPLLFRELVDILHDARQLDFLVALGTHPPLPEDRLCRLVGINAEERQSAFRQVGLHNHAWDDDSVLATLGGLEDGDIRRMSGQWWHSSLAGDLPVRINRAALACDHLLIVAPTFPHEVAGFSGGEKYLFPGISGPEMIHRMHWLAALVGVVETMGGMDTPVRALIRAAAAMLPTPVTLLALVAEGDGLAGVFAGDSFSAWESAVQLSAQRHIRLTGRAFERALSCAPPMYDELWTAAKAVYKIAPVMAEGGEVVLFAPHLDTVSRTHGRYIHEIGYHCLPYFLADWGRFREVPLGVLAHSTHLRGSGRMVNGVERPNLRVTLASRIPPEECARLNLGYLDPATINPAQWQDREEEGYLYVSKAGEILYRID